MSCLPPAVLFYSQRKSAVYPPPYFRTPSTERGTRAMDTRATVSTSTCTFPPAYNASAPSAPDLKFPRTRCLRQRVAPVNGPAHVLASRLPAGATHPVLPSLLVPCCAHSGTTFLWRCMRYAFHPERVCGSVSSKRGDPRLAWTSSEWTASSCAGKKYFLPGLAGNIQGHWDYRKEWFFYGGGAAAFDKGWADYAGVELPLCW